MKTSKSFGFRALSVFLCLSMLLAPIVTFAASVSAKNAGQASVMTNDQAAVIRAEAVLSTPIFKLVESEDEITGEDTYMFASSCTVGEVAQALGYSTTSDGVSVANVGEFVSGQKKVFSISSDITLGDGTVITAGTYVAAPDSAQAYEWYINDYKENIPLTASKLDAHYDAATLLNNCHWYRNVTYSNANDAYLHLVFDNSYADNQETCYEFEVNQGNNPKLTTSHKYMLMKYRTNYTSGKYSLQFAPKDGDPCLPIKYLEGIVGDGKWNYVCVDIGSFPQNLFKVRIDPFGRLPSKTVTTSNYFDIAYVSFFDSEKEAINYGENSPVVLDIYKGNDLATPVVSSTTTNADNYGEYVRFSLKVNSDDPTFNLRPVASVAKNSYIAVKYRTVSDIDTTYRGQLYNYDGSEHSNAMNLHYTDSKEWETFVFEDSQNVTASARLRLDIVDSTNGSYVIEKGFTIDIAYIAFFSSKEEAEQYGKITPVAATTYTASDFYAVGGSDRLTKTLSSDSSYTRFTHAKDAIYGQIAFNNKMFTAALTDSDSFLLLKYRTNAITDGYGFGKTGFGNIYVSSTNAEPSCFTEWVNDEDWHIMVVDVSKTDGDKNKPWTNRTHLFIRPVVDGERNEGAAKSAYYIDFAYAAFFASAEDALTYASLNGDAEEESYTFESAKTSGENLGYNRNSLAISSGTIEELDSVRYTNTATSFFAPVFSGSELTWNRANFLNTERGWSRAMVPSNTLYSREMTVFGYNSGTFNIQQKDYSADNTPVYTYVKVAEGVTLPAITAWLHTAQGNVAKGVSGAVDTGAVLMVREGDNVREVPITLDMLYTQAGVSVTAADAGPQENLIVRYNGVDVNYQNGAFVFPFTLTVFESTSFFKTTNKVFRLLDSPTADDPATLTAGKKYMFLEDNEKGYAKALGYTATTPNYTVTPKDVQVFELEVNGEKQCFVKSNNDTDYWELIEVTGYQQGTSGNRKYHYLMPETDFTFYQIKTGDGKQLLYYNLCGYGKNVNAIYREEAPSLVMADYTWFYNGTDIRRTASMWAEIPADGNAPYGTGLGVYSLAYKSDQGSGEEITAESTSTVREWRGLFYSHEHNNFGTRPQNTLDSIYPQKMTDFSVYDRVYYYEECDPVTATVYVDKTDIAVAYGAAGADLTGATLVITTTYGDTTSVERVPITMDMLELTTTYTDDEENDNNYEANTNNYLLTTGSPDAERIYQNVNITYQGITLEQKFENVVIAAQTDPAYPNPGSVIINKELDQSTHDYYKTGTARLELSVTGVPVSSGVDVVVCLDNSWSMETDPTADDSYTSRREMIRAALKSMLQSFQTQNAAGSDIAVSVLTFDGYDLMNGQLLSGGGDTPGWAGIKVDTNVDSSSRADYAQFISTGENNIEIRNIENRFLEKDEITATRIDEILQCYYLTGSGTNYDRGLELAYETLSDRQKSNALNGEKRESVVVFLGDGASLQYNYIGIDRQSGYAWAYLLAPYNDPNYTMYSEHAVFKDDTLITELKNNFYNRYSEQWVAEAIKGDTDKKYKVIDPDADPTGNNPNGRYVDWVNGLGAKIYTIGVGLDYGDTSLFGSKNEIGNGNKNLEGVEITAEIVASTEPLVAGVLNRISSNYSSETHKGVAYNTENGYCFSVKDDPAEIIAAFENIASKVSVLGNAVYTDTMSDHVELETEAIGESETPAKITLTEYEVYKFSEANTVVDGIYVSTDMVGTVKPGKEAGIPLESVTFKNDGNGNLTAAYSDKKGNTNILSLSGDVIDAQYFKYDLTTETFKWTIGDIPENKYVLSFDVYLIGSREGKAERGTYPTNSQAKLEYTNFEGQNRTITAPTPYLPWGGAQVSYGLYLVDDDGNPVTSINGSPVSFELSYKVSAPELHSYFNLNSETGKITAEHLPAGLSLYDDKSSYEVKANSDNGGAWVITKGEDKKASTYVTQYSSGSNAATNELKVCTGAMAAEDDFATGCKEMDGYTYANTVVWFAVTSPISASPETVVLDYGLPVDVDIVANDNCVGGFKATGIAKGDNYQETYSEESLHAALKKTSAVGTYGEVTLNTSTGVATYTPNTLSFSGADVFTYALDFATGTPAYASGTDYYTSTLTVIPATTIYYEDDFGGIEYKSYNYSDKEEITSGAYAWTTVGTGADEKQHTDLVGDIQANVYGYDQAYDDCATYSMGDAHKVTVHRGIKENDNGKYTMLSGGSYATVKFTFTGTGFDLVSLTSNKSGSIVVSVKNSKGVSERAMLLDTYYGYEYKNGEWTEKVTSDTETGLYQIPVIKVSGLDHGEHTVTITISHTLLTDHNQYPIYTENGTKYIKSDMYIDAIRIYDPAKGNETAEDAYAKDGESNPLYSEVRNKLIEAGTFNSTSGEDIGGAVFIDGIAELNDTNASDEPLYELFPLAYSWSLPKLLYPDLYDDDGESKDLVAISDYAHYGPNNEVYLAPGQSIAFNLAVLKGVTDVQLGVKSVEGSGNGTTVSVYQYENNALEAKTITVNSATDMYYSIKELVNIGGNANIVIKNTGSKLVSITNLKATGASSTATASTALKLSVSKSVAEEAMQVIKSVQTPEIYNVRTSARALNVGGELDVIVTTSSAAEYVVVNGVKCTEYTEISDSARVFEVTITPDAQGRYEVNATAYNAVDDASDMTSTSVRTKSAVSGIFNEMLEDFIMINLDR